jgi:hypothetical protein
VRLVLRIPFGTWLISHREFILVARLRLSVMRMTLDRAPFRRIPSGA